MMLKYCLECWDKHKGSLENELRSRTDLNTCEYIDLVRMVVKNVFVEDVEWDASEISVVDNGDYQGTLLFLIPAYTYHPTESEYLMTFVGYGSCSGCDTLQAIQECWSDDPLTEQQVKDFMALCKDIVTNTIKPYNYGWRSSERFTEVEMDDH